MTTTTTMMTTDGGDTGTTGGVPAACLETEWDESLAAFQEQAAANNNTYYYTQLLGGSGAFEMTCGYLTTVEVFEGQIIRRTFEIVEVPEGVDEGDCEEPFVEEADEINSHMDTGYAMPALPMEDQYDGCCDLLSLEPDEEYLDTFFVDEATGIARTCATQPINCADGCNESVDGFGGFFIQDFVFGTLE